MKIGVNITGDAQARTALQEASKRIAVKLRQAIERATFDLVGYVKARKLSDQVLRVRTGRLRRSITGRVESDGAQTVGLVGTNVSYARVHELGFKGRVKVRAHSRQMGGRRVKVRAHSREMDIPKRAFLVPSLNERMPTYRDWIATAAKEGARAPGA